MSFTYNLGSSSSTEVLVAKVRLHIGDTVQGTGVRPDGSNITDEEIEALLTTNEDDVESTVADLADILARHWANTVDVTTGPRRESLSQASKRWRDIADEMRASGTAGSGTSFSFAPDRTDGYSAYADDRTEYT